MYEELGAAGLTRIEAKIYNSLLELGKAQAGEISRKTGVHRRNVYDALERLIEKGLASFVKENNRRLYLPSSPNTIIETINMKRDALLGIMPMLQAKFNSSRQKQETIFYKGIQGIKSIFNDQLEAKKEILVITSSRHAQTALPYYIKHFTKKRLQLKINLKILYCGGERSKKMDGAELKFLPEEYASPVAVNIYGENAAIIVWGDEPVAILIRNKEVANAFRNYFSLLWKMARK